MRARALSAACMIAVMQYAAVTLVLLTAGCSSPTSPVAAAASEPAGAETPAAQSTAATATPSATSPRPAPEGPRTDFNALKPSYPITAVLPEGLKANTGITEETGDSGIVFGEAYAEIQLSSGKTLNINAIVDQAALAKKRTQDPAFPRKVELDESGPDGSWVYVTSGSFGSTVVAAVPKSGLWCSHTGNWKLDDAVRAGKACLSIRRTDGSVPRFEGPEHAFRHLEEAADRQAAWAVARAIVDNDRKALLALWPPEGAVVAGKRLKPNAVRAALDADPSIKKLLGWPARPEGETLSLQCTRKAKSLELFLASGYEGFWDLDMKKIGKRWMISRVPKIDEPYTL